MKILITADNRALWETRLTEAEDAYFKLATGKTNVTISYNGESLSKNAANLAMLETLIGKIQTALGLPGSNRAASRPITFG